jgi:glycosyltransferase involved in cell wall biosynthesis
MKFSLTIRDLLLDEQRRHTLGRCGRDRFRTKLAWERSEQKLLEMYMELLGAEQAGHVVAATEA